MKLLVLFFDQITRSKRWKTELEFEGTSLILQQAEINWDALVSELVPDGEIYCVDLWEVDILLQDWNQE